MTVTNLYSSDALNKGLERYLKPEAQKKLGAAIIGIAGAGGLGSNVAAHLVRSGVKNFVIADFDRVEASNLNRQFFFPDQIGKFKVDALAENLLRIAPDINLKLYPERLTYGNTRQIFEDCSAIIEAFDDPKSKKMLVESFMNTDRFLVVASGIGGYGSPDTIKARKIKENFYIVGDGQTASDKTIPPMSPRVGLAAAIQADLILMYFIGTLTGKEANKECNHDK
ncbi:sulfur carrier protein ThiS adenylyltransferase ThiF [Desulforegula conservatrix]|uniref:sulfur carrier protein ThiS adenylyltransferase ThiF n=1 Tax=Desulforegula conservatrix TaxID=153026 RepID=UPI0003F93EC7|nr:sulfur carrier protein ThiS adenylyltransferase ThiF [Desulforegula conservatrix]